jgi:hypothetical protein
LFAWHCLALTPTAKLQAIEVPKSDKFGGNHRLMHGCGNNRADYLPPDHLCRHLLLHVQATGAFQNATERSARHSHSPKALCGSRGLIHLHDFYWKWKSSKGKILKKALDFLWHVNCLSARQFCRVYRLSKEALKQLVTVISEHRQRAGRRPGRHEVDAKLSMALRWLGGRFWT